MRYEIDFLAVGKEGQSGDAITFRFGNLHGDRKEQYQWQSYTAAHKFLEKMDLVFKIW